MDIPTPNRQRLLVSVKQSIIYLLLIPVIVLALIAWVSHYRINDFKNNQMEIATSIVNSVANETSRLITENKRLVDIFIRHERENIINLIANPDDDNLKQAIEDKIRNYFPDYFTFTVVNNDGEPVIDDFDGYLGDICLSDIKTFAKTKNQSIQVHPNPYIYHTDTIAKVGDKNNDGYFFASFRTNVFSRLLKLSSPNMQSLMLINTKTPDLIEITEEGARITLDRNNYTLTAQEKARTLFSIPIAGTNWRLASFHNENLFSDYEYEVYSVGLVIFLLFLTGSILMASTLWRAEQQRIALKQTKEEMFSLFSHDLRSPLTSIYGAVQLIEMEADKHSLDDVTKKMLSDAVSNCEHMLYLLNDLLDIQKLESGMMSFEYENIELNAFIKNVINLNQRLAEMNHVQLHFESMEPLHADIDKQRLQQVLTNLITNAIKYSPDYDMVTIRLTRDDKGAVLTITDNGPGIGTDIQDTLFNKFTQSQTASNKNKGGTGLGLSIVKYIVEEHGGYVGFKSEPGKGTQFVVKIPLKR